MTHFTPWNAQDLHGIAVIEAQRRWLGTLTEHLSGSLHRRDPRSAVGLCLERLLSGLLQSLVSEEEAFRELGLTLDAAHIDAHNGLCLEILNLLRRNELGEPVGVQLLHCLQAWQNEHCRAEDRLLH